MISIVFEPMMQVCHVITKFDNITPVGHSSILWYSLVRPPMSPSGPLCACMCKCHARNCKTWPC